MNDTCEIHFLKQALRDLDKLAEADPDRALTIESLIDQVEENGWVLSTNSRLIRPLDSKNKIGEIREMGKGGHRMIFFWVESAKCRDLYITAIPKKKNVENQNRLNTFIESAAKLRKRFLAQQSQK